jgi:protein-L-isoaspartate O-methyltransferase
MAFGTGTHETTRLVIRLLEEEHVEGLRVLDVGTGSGILSICASKLGARSCNAYDIDPVAVKVARENVKDGGLDNITVGVSDLLRDVDLGGGKYDICLANIVADIIIRMLPDIRNYLKEGAPLILSGIINERAEEVRLAVGKQGFTIEKEIYNEETFTLKLEFSPKLVNRPYNLKALTYGPLVFALPIKTEYVMKEYVKNGVERKFPYCDYELIGDNDFNYGFSSADFKVSYDKGDEYPFSSKNPRIKITADMQKVSWNFAEYYKCYSDYKPNSNKAISEVKEKTLIPYGSAKLRMTEMPMIKK